MIDEKKIQEVANNESVRNLLRRGEKAEYIHGFKDGIDWFKKELWHPITEESERDKVILADFGEDDYALFCDTTIKELCDELRIYRWLYIDDLLKGE